MPVQQPANQSENRQEFELIAESLFPLNDIPPQTNIEIECFWKSEKNYWLRLRHPESEEGFDFRILKIYRFPEATHIVVSPARRWNQRRRLSSVTVLRLVNKAVACTVSEEELEQLKNTLTFKESFQICNEPEYMKILDDQLVRALGPYREWQESSDIDSLAMYPELIISGTLVKAGQEVEIDLDTTKKDPGFLKLKIDGKDCTFQIVSYFEVNKKSYLAVKREAEFSEGLHKPELILLELKSKHHIRVLEKSEFESIAEKAMDACEIGK